MGMPNILLRGTMLAAIFAGSSVLAHGVAASEKCSDKQSVARAIQMQAKVNGFGDPMFRIKRAADGQALLYWHYGDSFRSFYAVTFRANGCVILTDNGTPRRFIFPKSAYNSGVFAELDKFDLAL